MLNEPKSDRSNEPSKDEQRVTKTKRFNIAYFLLALLGVVILQNLFMDGVGPRSIPYSEFQALLADGKVEKVEISSDRIDGLLTERVEGTRRFVTTRVDGDLAAQLDAEGVVYSGRVEGSFLLTLLSWLMPALLFLGVWFFILRTAMSRANNGLMSIGKSKAKIYVESDTQVSFQDVAGVEEGKAELAEVVEFLRDPKRFGRLGARLPKGLLLVGPPGTGKTLLARAVAGEAGVPFFSINGSEFVEMFVGLGAARVRDLFQQARTKAPCIIFIDELDAMGKARSSTSGYGGHDEKEQTLNQLLVELDGFDVASGVVLIGATNRPEILDPALLRAGRFDRQILVDRPDKRGRAAILAVHLRGIEADPQLEIDDVAALTPGFSGADLANLVNEAALVATRRQAGAVTQDDFTAAIERLVAGLERKNRLLVPREREIVAHHEMGHALVAASVPTADAVQKVSIIPRGIGALGYTLQRPTDDRYLMTRSELQGRLAVLLGGRAAEHVVFGHLSTGAADDLRKATDIARSMVMQYGMVPELGHVAYEEQSPTFLPGQMRAGHTFSEETARRIDRAVRSIIDEAFDEARSVLEENRQLLVESARLLLDKETLDESDLAPLFDRVSVEPADSVIPGAA